MQIEAGQTKNLRIQNQQNQNNTQNVNQMIQQLNAETMLDLVLGPKYSHSQSTCPHCQHRFNKRSHLYRHLRQKHEQVRQYICSFQVCGKKFKRGSHLKRHMISHTHEKKFKCLKCIMEFGYKHHLDRHIKLIHDKEFFKCTQCDKQFNKKKGLAKHKKEHQMINLKKNKKIKKMKKQNKEEQDEVFNEQESEEELEKQNSMKQQLFQSSLQELQCQKAKMKSHINHEKNHQIFLAKTISEQHIQNREQTIQNNMEENNLNKNNEIEHSKAPSQLNICDLIGGQNKKQNKNKKENKKQQKEIILFRCDKANCLNVYKTKHALKNHYKNYHQQITLQIQNNQ